MAKYVVFLVLTLISIMVMATTVGGETIGDDFGNIILRSSQVFNCKSIGSHCFSSGECCPGSDCKTFSFLVSFCQWCPTSGYPCGMLDPCCPGYTCDGYVSGTCH